MLLTYPVFKRWRCSLCPTRCSWDPTKHLQSLCSKCARPTRNWRAWTKIGEQCQRRTALCFFVVVGLRKREILRNQFLQTDFTLLNGERNQFYSSTKGKLFRVVSWRKCMVGTCLVVSSLGLEASWWWRYWYWYFDYTVINLVINLLYDYIFPRSAFFNLSFVWKEGLHDQVPVIATVQLQTPLCFLLSCGRAFGSVAKRYNLSLSTRWWRRFVYIVVLEL